MKCGSPLKAACPNAAPSCRPALLIGSGFVALGRHAEAGIRLAAARSEIDEIGRTFDDDTLRELFVAGATAKLGETNVRPRPSERRLM